ncbi:MAG: hypothetical protein RML46_01730 [Anaerolineae bacterium]|nr:hypothetical protein [Anaerolineae bacterium]MDW8067615.1 hypothetical protein [Anaerolineae bacterium]
MYPDSEILFPPRCILHLRNLRGELWARFIDHLTQLPDDHEDVLGFSLLMIQLGSCLTCSLDSYRASLGCCTCARRTIAGFKGSDEELLQLFEEAREKVRAYLSGAQPVLSSAEEEAESAAD